MFSHIYAHAHTRTPLLSAPLYLLLCCSCALALMSVCSLPQAVHRAAPADGVDSGGGGSRGAPAQFLGGQR